jgi:hypothetical protein
MKKPYEGMVWFYSRALLVLVFGVVFAEEKKANFVLLLLVEQTFG